MGEYTQNRWVVLEFQDPVLHYKFLGGWSGSYTQGSSWRINSGIAKVVENGDFWEFHGSTWSIYHCHKMSYGLILIMMDPIKMLEKNGWAFRILEEDTDFHTLDFESLRRYKP